MIACLDAVTVTVVIYFTYSACVLLAAWKLL